ncbi:uncharacterized protein EDB91DRAFT_1064161 [Suillus paluster]|uniref:uncharacterized protein n=1 Tax=Suillus paluster TaxID=48578 RepID=UPI001B863AB6|nr:uncharacterized protein EDB91DRAFT_1064161 [Suillus paluster]KAG1721949.1 hypothetical protein EDB91DRAFT_1064161 [Suillus paluster]
MERERPTKQRTRFQEVARELPDAKYIPECKFECSDWAFFYSRNVIDSPETKLPNGGSSHLAITNLNEQKASSSISPSAQDIYKWTNTEKARAPCFIGDVLSMRESIVKGPNIEFYWLGHIPCRTVLIVGVVVGIQDSQKWRLYTVDDSTGVIECMLRHPQPYAHLDPKSRLEAARLSKLENAPPPPPPNPVTAIGHPVRVIGKVTQFQDERQIKAISIKPCESTNDQWKHVRTVVELHKSKYAVPKPFEIPVETLSDKLRRWSSWKRPLPAHEPSSPLAHSLTSAPSSLLIPGTIVSAALSSTHTQLIGSQDPPKFLHPSRLRTADLTDLTFQSYLKHYMQHAIGNVRHWDIGEWPLSTPTELQPTGILFASHGQASNSPAFTLSHLRRVPELALLASRVVDAETRRRARPDADAEKVGHTQSSSGKTVKTRSHPNTTARVRMKRLFMLAVLRLYKDGSVVLYDRPLPPPSSSVPVSSPMFSGLSSAKCVVPEEDAYLSDPPMYEEDEAYVPVTPALLAAPVWEIMRAKGIKGKSTEVGAEDITRDLRKLDVRWARITTRAVEEAVETIAFNY